MDLDSFPPRVLWILIPPRRFHVGFVYVVFNAALYSAVQCYALLYSAVLSCVAQYCSVHAKAR
jgi:hypothetical protein